MLLAFVLLIVLVGLLPSIVACVQGHQPIVVIAWGSLLPALLLLIAGYLYDQENVGRGGDLQGAYTYLAFWSFPVAAMFGAIVSSVMLWVRDRKK